jgi:hypothetical protein
MISMYQATPLYRNEQFLRDRYLKKQLSTGQIAREIRSARSSVLEGLSAYGIPMRSEKKAHQRNKGQLAYGERMMNGQVIVHKAEQRILKKIIKLRDQGHSFGQIADWLNTSGIPTKNAKKNWDRPTVYKIVKRTLEKRV